MRHAHTVASVREAEQDLMARLPEGTLMQRAAAAMQGVVVSTGHQVLYWGLAYHDGYVHSEEPSVAWAWTPTS